MTLVVCLRVNEGVVLAADSASSMVARYPDGRTDVSNVYNNANKVFNLYKGLPVGALTWGGGSIGEASISTLSKDFREQLEVQIDAASYTVMDIAERYALFLQNAYLTAYAGSLPQDTSTGFIIAGYSTGGQRAEVYEVVLRGGVAEGPTLVPEFPAIYLAGQTEAAERLIYGVDPKFPIILRDNLGVPEAQIAPTITVIVQALYRQLDNPAMPIQDAIDLAEFLVDFTIKYTRFLEGAQTVGGPIEIAVITKHEKFKWVRRKHYFDTSLNPA